MDSSKRNDSYNPQEIESKWQKYWQEKGTYKVDEDYKNKQFQNKYY